MQRTTCRPPLGHSLSARPHVKLPVHVIPAPSIRPGGDTTAIETRKRRRQRNLCHQLYRLIVHGSEYLARTLVGRDHARTAVCPPHQLTLPVRSDPIRRQTSIPEPITPIAMITTSMATQHLEPNPPTQHSLQTNVHRGRHLDALLLRMKAHVPAPPARPPTPAQIETIRCPFLIRLAHLSHQIIDSTQPTLLRRLRSLPIHGGHVNTSRMMQPCFVRTTATSHHLSPSSSCPPAEITRHRLDTSPSTPPLDRLQPPPPFSSLTQHLVRFIRHSSRALHIQVQMRCPPLLKLLHPHTKQRPPATLPPILKRPPLCLPHVAIPHPTPPVRRRQQRHQQGPFTQRLPRQRTEQPAQRLNRIPRHVPSLFSHTTNIATSPDTATAGRSPPPYSPTGYSPEPSEPRSDAYSLPRGTPTPTATPLCHDLCHPLSMRMHITQRVVGPLNRLVTTQPHP